MRELEQNVYHDMEETYSQVRTRILWCIPLNMGLCYAAFKCQGHITSFTKKYVLRGRKQTMRTLIPVSLLQSFTLFGMTVGLNCAVLSVNPFTVFSRLSN